MMFATRWVGRGSGLCQVGRCLLPKSSSIPLIRPSSIAIDSFGRPYSSSSTSPTPSTTPTPVPGPPTTPPPTPTSPPNPETPPKQSTLKRLIKQYGPAAWLTFEGISEVNFFGWFIAIHLGADVQPIIDYATDLKDQYFGPSAVEEPSVQTEATIVEAVSAGAAPDAASAATDASSYSNLHHHKAGLYTILATEFILAHAINGLFLPLRIALTVYLTPKVAQKLVASGWDAWLRKQIGRIPWIGKRLN